MKKDGSFEIISRVGPGGDIAPVQDVCGNIFPIPFVRGVGFSQAIAEVIKPSIPHYHKMGFETYFIVSGTGRIMVGDAIHLVGESDFIQIEPLTAHYILPHEKMTILVSNAPPWAADDQFVLVHSNPDVKFDARFESIVLINTLIHVADLSPSEFVQSIRRMSKEDLRESIGGYIR